MTRAGPAASADLSGTTRPDYAMTDIGLIACVSLGVISPLFGALAGTG